MQILVWMWDKLFSHLRLAQEKKNIPKEHHVVTSVQLQIHGYVHVVSAGGNSYLTLEAKQQCT